MSKTEDLEPEAWALFCVRHRKILLVFLLLAIPAAFTSTIMLSGVEFKFNTELESFIQSDEIPSLQFDAVAAAKEVEANVLDELIKNFTDPKNGQRRILQQEVTQGNSNAEIVLFYNATVTSDIFSPEVLSDMQAIEQGIRSLDGFSEFCQKSSQDCLPFKSIVNFFFPRQTQSGTGTVYVFDGLGEVQTTKEQGIEQLLKTSGSIWLVDKTFTSNGRHSAVARTVISTGLPLIGYESADDRRSEQIAKTNSFLIERLYPYLVESSTEHVRVMWYSELLSEHEIISSAFHDAIVGTAAIGFVFIAMWLHLGSVVITGIALLSIGYAFPISYCVVAIGLQKPELSLFVVLSVFIIVGIGADDTFLFYSIWKQSSVLMRRASSHIVAWKNVKGGAKPGDRVLQDKILALRLQWTFSHASSATLVTSCTTATSFLANLASPVVPIRDFGLFMGVLVIANYVCIILIIPIALVVQEHDVLPLFQRVFWCFGKKRQYASTGNSKVDQKAPLSGPQSPSTVQTVDRDAGVEDVQVVQAIRDHAGSLNSSESEIVLEDVPIMIDCGEGDGGYRESIQSLTSFELDSESSQFGGVFEHDQGSKNSVHEDDDLENTHELLREREKAIARAIDRIVDRSKNGASSPQVQDVDTLNLKSVLEKIETGQPGKVGPESKRRLSERMKKGLLQREASEAMRQLQAEDGRLMDRDEVDHVISKEQGFSAIEVIMHNKVAPMVLRCSIFNIIVFFAVSATMAYIAISRIDVSDELPKFFKESQNLGSLETIQIDHFGETKGNSRSIPIVVPSCSLDPETGECTTFTCPGQESECSGHGTCNSGTCSCDSNFKGEDCAAAWTAADLSRVEALAWESIFDGFGGSGWTVCSDSRAHPCGCDRITCVPAAHGSGTRTMQRVDLSNNALAGTITGPTLDTFTASLAAFINLESMGVAGNPSLLLADGACWDPGACGEVECLVPDHWVVCSDVSPTPFPTPLPTPDPTVPPTPRPSVSPTTLAPTTAAPTGSPSTIAPTNAPSTLAPSAPPTASPTAHPTTLSPTNTPTTLSPTVPPTLRPTTPPVPGVTPAPVTPTPPPTTPPPTTPPPTTPPPSTPPPTNSGTLAPSASPNTPPPTSSEARLQGGSLTPLTWIDGLPIDPGFVGATFDLSQGGNSFNIRVPFAVATVRVQVSAVDPEAALRFSISGGGLALVTQATGSYLQDVPIAVIAGGAVLQVEITVTATDGTTSEQYSVTIERLFAECNPSCENGSCERGSCECDEGFIGDSCQIQACPGDCFGNGDCVVTDDVGECDCFDGYLSANCSIPDTSLEGLPDYRAEVITVNFGIDAFIRAEQLVEYDPSFVPSEPEVQESLLNICIKLGEDEIDPVVKENIGLRRVKSCPFAGFYVYMRNRGEPFPVVDENQFYENFYAFLLANRGFQRMVGLDRDGKLRRVSIEIQTNIDRQLGAVAAEDEFGKWETFIQDFVQENAPNLPEPQQVSQLWARTATETAAVNGTILAFVVSAACAFAAIFIFTGNIVIALWNTVTIVAIVATLLGVMVLVLGLKLGVIEAVALSVFCGLNVDYACHLSHSYNNSVSETRFGKTRHSLTTVGGSILGAAFTTVGSSFFLVFCKIQIFVTFGIVLAINMCLAITFSFLLFCALLLRLGPVNHCGSVYHCPPKVTCAESKIRTRHTKAANSRRLDVA